MFQQMTTRLLALALGILVLFAVAACESNASPPTATPVAAPATATPVVQTGAKAVPSAVQTGGPAAIPTGGPAPVQTGAPALTPTP